MRVIHQSMRRKSVNQSEESNNRLSFVTSSIEIPETVKHRYKALLSKQKQYVSACDNLRAVRDSKSSAFRSKIPEVTDMKSMKDLIISIESTLTAKDDRRNGVMSSKKSRKKAFLSSGMTNLVPQEGTFLKNPVEEPNASMDRPAT